MSTYLIRSAALLTLGLALASCGAETGSRSTGANPEVTISPTEGPPTTIVRVDATGFPPDEDVEVGAGPVASEYEVLARTTADSQGRIDANVAIQGWAEPGREWIVVVRVEGTELKAASPVFQVTDGRGPAPRDETVTVIGRLTDEGVECQALRSEDGELFTLTGDLGDLAAGARVRVVATPAEMSFCMQGTTLAVERIEPLPAAP